MKIRQGFVSNSSSSSFIVGFEKKPETVEEMKELLFGEQKILEYWEDHFSTEEIADIVFRDIQKQKPMTEKKITKFLINSWDAEEDLAKILGIDSWENRLYYYKDKEEYKRELSEVYNRQCDLHIKKISKKRSKEFIKKCQTEGKIEIYRFRYADEDGSLGAAMEHGEIFNNLPNYRRSEH